MILEDAADLDPFVEIELQTAREECSLPPRHGRWLSKIGRLLRTLFGSLGSLWRRLQAPPSSRLAGRRSTVSEHARVDVMAWSSQLQRAGSMDLFASPSRDLEPLQQFVHIESSTSSTEPSLHALKTLCVPKICPSKLSRCSTKS
ncbi:uncharacterized protein [Dermacentor albipictus]|uniref:uncharacterized protein n=1 Tax=Dermacentor albipictus TaxID=60249 RepID=UPI0031FC4653